MPGLVSFSSGELVGRLPTLFTNPGTPSNQRSENVRTVRLRLLPSGSQGRKLWKLGDATAKLWNELNYARLMQFRTSGKVDFKGTGREPVSYTHLTLPTIYSV